MNKIKETLVEKNLFGYGGVLSAVLVLYIIYFKFNKKANMYYIFN